MELVKRRVQKSHMHLTRKSKKPCFKYKSTKICVGVDVTI